MMRNRRTKLIQWLCITIIISILRCSAQQQPNCSIVSFTSVSTECEIQFQKCASNSGDEPSPEIQQSVTNLQNPLKFVSCRRRRCLSKLANGQCRLPKFFDLEEKRCYRQCCGSAIFDTNQCIVYNKAFQIRQERLNTFIIIFLAVCVAITCIGIVVFVIMRLKCFHKERKQLISHPKLQWIESEGSSVGLNRCEICKKGSAPIETICQHWYHETCFFDAGPQNECPQCFLKLESTTVTIHCLHCWGKSVKTRFMSSSQFWSLLSKAKIQHFDLCEKKPPETDIRLSRASDL